MPLLGHWGSFPVSKNSQGVPKGSENKEAMVGATASLRTWKSNHYEKMDFKSHSKGFLKENTLQIILEWIFANLLDSLW